ncbi:MotA/TolQ/ExbB proton channel family protein, partial [Pseudomonas syringae group genomosp. 3]
SEGSLARLTDAGAQALATPHDSPDLGHSWNRQDLLERSLRQQIHKERRRLESGMILLASIGSTAPFIGLFGTVFGIIHALTAISQAKSASIAVVAGPIGEALVATGVGIAVAVPAVLAYNFFGRRMKLVIADLKEFAVDFLNLSQRNAFRLQPESRDKAAPNLKGVS